MNTLLDIQHISKAFFGIAAVKDVCLTIHQGEILGLIGQNGAGKSTLMNVVGGVVQPDTGSLLFDGKLYTPRKPGDAYNPGGFKDQQGYDAALTDLQKQYDEKMRKE